MPCVGNPRVRLSKVNSTVILRDTGIRITRGGWILLHAAILEVLVCSFSFQTQLITVNSGTKLMKRAGVDLIFGYFQG